MTLTCTQRAIHHGRTAVRTFLNQPYTPCHAPSTSFVSHRAWASLMSLSLQSQASSNTRPFHVSSRTLSNSSTASPVPITPVQSDSAQEEGTNRIGRDGLKAISSSYDRYFITETRSAQLTYTNALKIGDKITSENLRKVLRKVPFPGKKPITIICAPNTIPTLTRPLITFSRQLSVSCPSSRDSVHKFTIRSNTAPWHHRLLVHFHFPTAYPPNCLLCQTALPCLRCPPRVEPVRGPVPGRGSDRPLGRLLLLGRTTQGSHEATCTGQRH